MNKVCSFLKTLITFITEKDWNTIASGFQYIMQAFAKCPTYVRKLSVSIESREKADIVDYQDLIIF